MMNQDDRRAPGATRIPFEGLVEVGGTLGPSFEAQAIDVSAQGIHLRTAYLPDVGTKLSCRFETGPEATVFVTGEVVWRRDEGAGGEFGVRFDPVDQESSQALREILGPQMAVEDNFETASGILPGGARVRLHIEGLASPMRAKVRDGRHEGVTVGSELGFLRIGRELQLEDATTGAMRSAQVDKVQVELDQETRVPNLVVALRYEAVAGTPPGQPSAPDAEIPVSVSVPPAATASSLPPVAADVQAAKEDSSEHDVEALKRASKGAGEAFLRKARATGPVLAAFARRVGKTATLLAEKAKGTSPAPAPAAPPAPLRRTTAKAPGGGLHAQGRRVVRGEIPPPADVAPPVVEVAAPRPRVDRRRMALGALAGLSVIAIAVATRKPSEPPAVAVAEPAAPPATVAAAEVPPVQAAPPAPTAPVLDPVAATAPAPMDDTTDPLAEAKADGPVASKGAKPKVQPFSNGAVTRGNLLRLHMDGTIEKIQGAPQPTGFTVVVPNRRSLEAAGPLAAKDGRIASIRVTNDPNGAELNVNFKDGVPNYVVRAKGDVLEIVLAGGAAAAEPDDKTPAHSTAKHTERGHGHGHGKRHGKNH